MTTISGRPGDPAKANQDVPADDVAWWAGLAARIAAGDAEAEAELARALHQRVRMLLAVRLRGSDAASDIAQDTMIAVLEALRGGKLRELEKLPAFALGVARNLLGYYRRKETRRLQVFSEQLPDGPAEPDASLAAADAERRALMREALKRLNPLDRRILLLTLVEGMTPREIAPIVGLTQEVVRTRKCRAAQAVRDDVAGRETNAAAEPHR